MARAQRCAQCEPIATGAQTTTSSIDLNRSESESESESVWRLSAGASFLVYWEVDYCLNSPPPLTSHHPPPLFYFQSESPRRLGILLSRGHRVNSPRVRGARGVGASGRCQVASGRCQVAGCRWRRTEASRRGRGQIQGSDLTLAIAIWSHDSGRLRLTSA